MQTCNNSVLSRDCLIADSLEKNYVHHPLFYLKLLLGSRQATAVDHFIDKIQFS